MYTGRLKTDAAGWPQQDTVGPALYNPNMHTHKKRAHVGDFQTSKQTRKLFEPSIDVENKLYPPRDIPGPGSYDEPAVVKEGKQFASSGNYSIFTSKVPNCKDAKIKNDKPGPGHYTNVFPKTTAGDNSGHNMSVSGESKFGASTSPGKQNINPFMSTTTRGDFWKNDVSAPFTK